MVISASPQPSPTPLTQGGGRKLAQQVAERLEDEIVAAGWPVGTVIGSETELIERFGVSRAVFREAIRVLEHHDVAYMRRGPGGGLVVKAPDSTAAVRAAALSLGYRNATWEQIFEARSALELKCVEIASQRIDEAGIARLREALAADEEAQKEGKVGSHDLHTILAELTGNPAFVLFIDVLTQLTRRPGAAEQPPSAAVEVRHAHSRIVEAVIAGDGALARHRMHAHLDAMGPWIQPPVAEEAR